MVIETTSSRDHPVIRIEVPDLKLTNIPKASSRVTYGLTGQKVSSRSKKLVSRSSSFSEDRKSSVKPSTTPRSKRITDDMTQDPICPKVPLRRYNFRQSSSSSTPFSTNQINGNRTNQHPPTIPEVDLTPNQKSHDSSLKPIFVPTAWSMPYKPPIHDSSVIPVYPRDILQFRQGPEKTLTEIRASQSILMNSLKKSIFSTAKPPPVSPASRQVTNV
ncbi:uncharacterized protein LOC134848255 isoform X1 [Symsagittifera roscoffensis]|uniref:uncharacterized protein LOC134848255 isoform X1 n=1 Tax=Symsagittifera roscoffensis TaxID=84072 RepID=UPI00307C03DF